MSTMGYHPTNVVALLLHRLQLKLYSHKYTK